MKQVHILLLISLSILFFSCDSNQIENIDFEDKKPSHSNSKKYQKVDSVSVSKGYMLFKTNCKSCHDPTLRKKKVGPPLLGITDRRDSVWIMNFIRNSQKMIQEGDLEAIQVYKEYNMGPMPRFYMLPQEELNNIYFYLKEMSDLAKK